MEGRGLKWHNKGFKIERKNSKQHNEKYKMLNRLKDGLKWNSERFRVKNEGFKMEK